MKPARSTAIARRKDGGFIAILLLVTIALMTVAAFTNSMWGGDANAYQQQVNREALRQAKIALLEYVETGDASDLTAATVLTAVNGRLPCPNQDGSGVSTTPCGTNVSTGLGLNAGIHSFGLLPWATLNIPTLRDAAHQCLWYAVDGLFKMSPLTDATTAAKMPVNADSFGSFSVVQPLKNISSAGVTSWTETLLAGNYTANNNSADRVVAVIIASGPAGGLQNQTAVGGGAYPCTLTNLAGGVPNAEASAPNFLKYYQSADPLLNVINNQTVGNLSPNSVNPTPLGALKTFVTADVNQEQLNDQFAWITAEEFAKAATRRTARLYASAINKYVSYNGFYPWAASTPGGACTPGQLQGFVPYSCPGALAADDLDLAVNANRLTGDPDWWAGHGHYAVSKDCISKTAAAKPLAGSGGTPAKQDSLLTLNVTPAHPCTGTDRIDLGKGTLGPPAIILMRGRALNWQTTTATPCVPYNGTNAATILATSNISPCLEDPLNKSTVNTAFASPKLSPALLYGTAPYRVPQPASSNDYMVQFTLQ